MSLLVLGEATNTVLTIDLGPALAAAGTLGTTIGGAILTAAKWAIAHQAAKDTRHEKIEFDYADATRELAGKHATELKEFTTKAVERMEAITTRNELVSAKHLDQQNAMSEKFISLLKETVTTIGGQTHAIADLMREIKQMGNRSQNGDQPAERKQRGG